MRLYRVGVLGHRPHRFVDEQEVKALCREVATTLADQYAPNQVWFNLTGAPGTSQWFSAICLELGLDYQFFCPCPPELYSAEWRENQKIEFHKQLEGCSGLMVEGEDLTEESVCGAAKALVDHSDFVVAFWEGLKYGLTYETIGYAVENSKLVLEANSLALITRKDLVKDSGETE